MSKGRFKKEDIKRIKKIFSKVKSITKTARQFCAEKGLEYGDSDRRKVSYLLEREGVTKNKPIDETEEKIEALYNEGRNRTLQESKYYIVTWEQNNTPLHTALWENILAYKEFLNAEISVILGRYKNPTSVFQDKDYDVWNEKTRPYWDANRHDIHKYLTILGDVKIQPTASNPLTGLESITGETTTIIGHPKMWLKPVPVLEGHPKKILISTGSISLPNYTDSKSGKRGEFHHKLGFIIVEIKDDEVFFIRQVEADKDGNFIDLFYEVKDGLVVPLDRAEALIWGDTHIASINSKIISPTIELTKRLNIKTEVHHDLVDGSSTNNHIINNPMEKFKNMELGLDSVDKELKNAVLFLKTVNPDTKKIVVQSNHNDRFDRWLVNEDWKKDMKNSLTYLKYAYLTLEGKAQKGVVAYYLEEHFSQDKVLCLDYDDSLMMAGYELAHHGHIGANGSRGTLEQFRKMSTNIILGHYHTPYRADRVLSVGTSSKLREGYNKGASSWMNAHVLLHKNGTAQHIIFADNEYTTFN